ncbi:MAG TPA: polysaccharide deacetylase family protein [Cellvibrio sp.]|nr:polysaccharide deacetylase family protein [Cellvibrio sp.]
MLSVLRLAMLVALMVTASYPVVADPVGPAAVATVDAKLWPETVNTGVGFDKASRAALLVYLRNLQTLRVMSDAEMMATFKIKSVNRGSVEKWFNAEQASALGNYQLAAADCSKADWTCVAEPESLQLLLAAADAIYTAVPKNAVPWRDNIDAFTRTYIGEQMRLAALFPRVSSEIDIFSDREWTGSGLADKQFFLSFDDGPTAVGGHSDATLAMLEKEKKSASFFVLGGNFQNRVNATSAANVKTFYGNQCVALHGWEHQSHAKWELWQDSIIRSQALLAKTLEKNNLLPLFRPPYGQRRDDSGDFFKTQSMKVALWNIDSQDWNARMDARAVESRIMALMLLKRHGVILFHDIHPKAAEALPKIFAGVGNAVTWSDCHALTAL